MTCRGETATYNQRNVSVELGGKISKKYTMGKGTRECNKVVKAHNVSPGPGEYSSNANSFINKNDNMKLGKFTTSKR